MSRKMTDKELVDLMIAAPHNFTIIKPLPRAECSDCVRGYVLDPLPDLELNGVNIRNVASDVIALVEQKRATDAQHNELLAALKKYEQAFDEIFAQCCSNPVYDAWGKPVAGLSTLSEAHYLAGKAIWTFCEDALPPEETFVEVQEATGQLYVLKRVGIVWFYRDGAMFEGFRLLRWRAWGAS